MRFEQIEINIVGDTIHLCQDDPMEDHPVVISFPLHQWGMIKSAVDSLTNKDAS